MKLTGIPKVLNLKPAYGRVYMDAETTKRMWNEGKDFKIVGGPYCSIRDLPKIKADGYTNIVISTGNVIVSLTLD